MRTVENCRGTRDRRKSLPERQKMRNAGSFRSRRRVLPQLSAGIPQFENARRVVRYLYANTGSFSWKPLVLGP